MRLTGIFVCLLFICLGFGCDQSTEILKPGAIEGMVRGIQEGNPAVYPAYIFQGDSLLAETDGTGFYRIQTLSPASYQLTCSALDYGNSIRSVEVQENKTTTFNFDLSPDTTRGRVYGEFQDLTLYQERLAEDSTMQSWTEKEIFDGGTYATLQTKWLGYEVPDRMVYLGDQLLAYSDGFGQYWFEIQCGTYPITGSCEGYESVTHTVTVSTDEPVYVNFILPRSTDNTSAQRR